MIASASTSLTHFAAARRELAIATSVDEVKDIRDKAEAMRIYVRQAGESLEMQNQCAEIKLRAERRAGEILSVMELHGGDRRSSSHDGNLKLSDIGISGSQSSRWQSIASIPEEDFEDFVLETKSAGRELTSSGAVKLAKKLKAKEVIDVTPDLITCNVETLGEVADLGVKFPCIYADPPWNYGNQGTRASTDNHYPTMTLDDIAALPIASLASDKALLFFWTTNAFLFESKPIIEAWGFEYKSVIVWCKPQMGIGNYVRVSHEFLLIANRGGLRSNGENQMSWVETDRKRHSEKPRVFREIVETICPHGPRLELFAREAAPGWVAWGNQVEKTLFTDSVSELAEGVK